MITILSWVVIVINLACLVCLQISIAHVKRLRNKMLEEINNLQMAKAECIATSEALQEVIRMVRAQYRSNVVEFPGGKK